MTYLQRFSSNTHKKNWICSCGRKNSNDEEVCGFCQRAKPEKGKKEGKIRSTKTDYNGNWYHSAGEAEYAQELDFRMKAGEIIDIKRQYKIDIKINGVHITNYFCDFRVVLRDQTVQYHEYKGWKSDRFNLVWRM